MKRLADLNEDGVRLYMELLARATESVMPAGARFAVIVFDESRTARYVSNVDRADVITAMREIADRLEQEDRFVSQSKGVTPS